MAHDGLPELPPYDQASEWLEGICTVNRFVSLFYNPEPGGGTSSLQLHSSGTAAGVGLYELHMVSDVVSSRLSS